MIVPLGNLMFLNKHICPRSFAFRANICFEEHQISAGQLSADSSSTETLYCLIRVCTSALTLRDQQTAMQPHLPQPFICGVPGEMALTFTGSDLCFLSISGRGLRNNRLSSIPDLRGITRITSL